MEIKIRVSDLSDPKRIAKFTREVGCPFREPLFRETLQTLLIVLKRTWRKDKKITLLIEEKDPKTMMGNLIKVGEKISSVKAQLNSKANRNVRPNRCLINCKGSKGIVSCFIKVDEGIITIFHSIKL